MQQANYTEEDDEEVKVGSLFMATQNPTMASKHVWFIDSGCTNHMTKDEDLFTKLDKTCRTKVKLGNGAIVEAQGKGTIQIQTKQGTKLFIMCSLFQV